MSDRSPRMLLEGKKVVVTGGCGGIGAAFAKRASLEGAVVISWDLEDRPDGDGINFVACDVANESSVAAALAITVERFGVIDVLLNNAGIIGQVAPLENYRLDEWQRVFAVNATGTFLCCRAVVPVMKMHGSGRIVNIASVAGKDGNVNQSAYSASKAAVIALTKSLGKELATTGIRVNCVAPAIIETGLLLQMGAEQHRLVLDKIPMGRAGLPEELAAMLVWLASEECAYSTGAVFDFSGGRATY